MTTLFDDGDDAATQVSDDRPAAKVVRALEGYGYRAEAVRRWTAEKASTVLHACRKEERIALRRATGKAQQQDGTGRGQPSTVERLAAATCIEDAAALGIDELNQTLMYTVYCLTDDELKQVANWFVGMFRGGEQ